jgi:hypothetical protein
MSDHLKALKTKMFYCQPNNKNEADKRSIAEWLRANGGSNLVKERAAVDGTQIDKLNEDVTERVQRLRWIK